MQYKNSLAKDPPTLDGAVVTAGYKTEKANNLETTKDIVFTAKGDMTLVVYFTVCNDSYNSDRDGNTVNYTVTGGNTNTLTSAKKKEMQSVTVELKAGQSLTLNVTFTEANDSGALWLFGYDVTPLTQA